MAAKTSWHRYGKKLRHCGPMYTVHGGVFCTLQLCMMVNGVEQVRLAMLALPRALDFDTAPPEGESWSQTVVTAIDGSVCASIGHVAQHVADKVTTILYIHLYSPAGRGIHNIKKQ